MFLLKNGPTFGSEKRTEFRVRNTDRFWVPKSGPISGVKKRTASGPEASATLRTVGAKAYKRTALAENSPYFGAADRFVRRP